MPNYSYIIGFFISYLLVVSCSSKQEQEALYENISSSESGLVFSNTLSYNEQLNAYTYRNFYNGAGVAIGDINNDGLEDIYLAGNQVDNKLFLNKGDLKFEDITNQAKVASPNVWSSGVSMADINGDGYLDIYVCKSGPLEGGNRNNELFINNGDQTFTESAQQWGVADKGLSNHAAFFDYDKDGDLDMYLLNNSTRSVGIYDLRRGQREVRDTTGGNKLYRNDGDKFTDVSEAAGIYGSSIGYGLGVTFADVNGDSWQDIFVSNDFFERDYLYINNQNGTFREALEETIQETSLGSMGADIGDLNGDGRPEIFVTEMLPDNHERVKTKTVFENWDKHEANVSSGYHYQFTRNTLQWNRGNVKDGIPVFSEISRLAGIEATDWSWGALIFDYNNDGKDDLFIANGIYKDLTDQDYINFYANNTLQFEEYRKDSILITKLIDVIPSVPLSNYLFENHGQFKFSNVSKNMGISEPVFSNGAAYSDLDNDGDLELVINSINHEVLLYKNKSIELNDNHFIKFNFGTKGHEYFGTKITVISGDKRQTKEYAPVKGYMSSMSHEMHFGLGSDSTNIQVIATWPDGSKSTISQVEIDQSHQLDIDLYAKVKIDPVEPKTLFKGSQEVTIQHQENKYSDFDRDRLLFQMSSNEGPATAVGDINGDHLEDLFIGGSKGFPGQIVLQHKDGWQNIPLEQHIDSEDTHAELVDMNKDGFLDLLVASGGHEFSYRNSLLKDRLYINDGLGHFTLSQEFDPPAEPSAFLKAIDFDNDGDMDLLSGSRQRPFAYGVKTSLHLFENTGNSFVEVFNEAFQELGLITSCQIADIDNDGDQDIVMAGEWMPIMVFENKEAVFTDVTMAYGLEHTSGLWHHINLSDVNGDGKIDILAGNHGSNTRLKASRSKPLRMYVNDFDNNSSVEQIITQYEGEKAYPIVMLPDLIKQLPPLKKKYVKHEAYKNQTMEDIFDQQTLERSQTLEVKTLNTTLFLQEENQFNAHELPFEAQISQIYASHMEDLNQDGLVDIILAGNQKRIKPELGSNNASYGVVLLAKPDGFYALPIDQSGIYVPNETRHIEKIKIDEKEVFVFIRNNEKSLAFELN